MCLAQSQRDGLRVTHPPTPNISLDEDPHPTSIYKQNDSPNTTQTKRDGKSVQWH